MKAAVGQNSKNVRDNVQGVKELHEYIPNALKESLFISPPTLEVTTLKEPILLNLTLQDKTKTVS
jgi:hypothetical protein